MSLRTKKQGFIPLIRLYEQRKMLSPEAAEGFEKMARQCRSQADLHQVWEAVRGYLSSYKSETDRNSMLLRDDILVAQEPEDPPELAALLAKHQIVL